MNKINIIIPLHKFNDVVISYTRNAIKSIVNNIPTFNGELITTIVCPEEVYKNLDEYIEIFKKETKYDNINVIINNGDTDFCNQINYAVQNINEDYFSILEFDDEYAKNWFKMVQDYYYTNEDVSVFLPINVQHNNDKTKWQFGNEIVWASSFSNDIGYIDFDCLQNCSTFNLTGGVFNRNDFIKIGMLKPSIKVAFNYEFLLRLTNNNLKVFVVPKEGYTHVIGREDSLTDIYNKTIQEEEIKKWFELAMREYPFTEDRKKGIVLNSEEVIK